MTTGPHRHARRTNPVGTPGLLAIAAGYVARQLADYKSGKRKSSAMQPMMEGSFSR